LGGSSFSLLLALKAVFRAAHLSDAGSAHAGAELAPLRTEEGGNVENYDADHDHRHGQHEEEHAESPRERGGEGRRESVEWGNTTRGKRGGHEAL